MEREMCFQAYNFLANYRAPQGVNLSTKFLYAIDKNLTALEHESEFIRKSVPAITDKMKEFEDKRKAILIACTKKDEQGNPIFLNHERGELDFEVSIEEVDTKVKELQKDYEMEIYEFEEKNKEFQNFLKEDSGISIYQVSIDDFPKDMDSDTYGKFKFMLK